MPLVGTYQPSAWPAAREQVEQYEASGGLDGNTFNGSPVVILTMTGKSSGSLRKTPVMRVEKDGKYLLVASMGGAPVHPQWYHNVSASPLVELQDGAERRDYSARELEGDERDEWWEIAVAAFGDYAEYQAGTTRVIPLLLLEPVAH